MTNTQLQKLKLKLKIYKKKLNQNIKINTVIVH